MEPGAYGSLGVNDPNGRTWPSACVRMAVLRDARAIGPICKLSSTATRMRQSRRRRSISEDSAFRRCEAARPVRRLALSPRHFNAASLPNSKAAFMLRQLLQLWTSPMLKVWMILFHEFAIRSQYFVPRGFFGHAKDFIW